MKQHSRQEFGLAARTDIASILGMSPSSCPGAPLKRSTIKKPYTLLGSAVISLFSNK